MCLCLVTIHNDGLLLTCNRCRANCAGKLVKHTESMPERQAGGFQTPLWERAAKTDAYSFIECCSNTKPPNLGGCVFKSSQCFSSSALSRLTPLRLPRLMKTRVPTTSY